MTYAFLTISREEEGRQIVRAPRTTDVIGHSLRGAYEEAAGMPPEWAAMLRQLDSMPNRQH